MTNALRTRELGQFPVSIATSLALEGALGILDQDGLQEEPIEQEGSEEDSTKAPPKKDKAVPISDFEVLYIDLRTLLRNIDGAVQSGVVNTASPMDYYKVLFTEVQVIDSILANLNPRPHLKFFASTYRSFTGVWPHALFRENTSDRAKLYSRLENLCLEYISGDIKKGLLSAEHVEIFDTRIELRDKKALLLSHYPVNLLLSWPESFTGLLESHTGAIKRRSEWNTKLRDGKKYPRIPFDKGMIQVFGDSANMLGPQTLAARRKLAELSEKHKWNALTSKSLILTHVRMANEPVLLDLLKKVY